MIGQRQHILDSITAQRHLKWIMCELHSNYMFITYYST